MLYRDNDILIFDEPTAVLLPDEIDELIEKQLNIIESVISSKTDSLQEVSVKQNDSC